MTSQILSPSTMADDATVGTVAWSNPDNAKVSDGVYATVSRSFALSERSHYLKATNFGFSIPTGATITGILAEVEVKSSISGQYDFLVQLVKGGTIQSTNKGSINLIPTTEAYLSYGSSSDLWETTWTPANINDSTFGIVWTPIPQSGVPTISVDHIRITVYYTESTIITGVQSMTGVGTIIF